MTVSSHANSIQSTGCSAISAQMCSLYWPAGSGQRGIEQHATPSAGISSSSVPVTGEERCSINSFRWVSTRTPKLTFLRGLPSAVL